MLFMQIFKQNMKLLFIKIDFYILSGKYLKLKNIVREILNLLNAYFGKRSIDKYYISSLE